MSARVKMDSWLAARLDGELACVAELGGTDGLIDVPTEVVADASVRLEILAAPGRVVALVARVLSVGASPEHGWVRAHLEFLPGPGRLAVAGLLSTLRKGQHLTIAALEDVENEEVSAGWDKLRFTHESLPELHADDIQMGASLFGRRLRAPIVIAGMTGGSPRAGVINERLAKVAHELGLAMGLGSQRAMLEDPRLLPTFSVRELAPQTLLLANVGAVQFNKGVTVAHCRRLVKTVGADVLCVHLNVLQEMIQPEGDRDWRGLVPRIADVVDQVGVPVILKETGCGLSASVAKRALQIGVAGFDVGGLGGTHWGWLEGFRTADPERQAIAATFREWGIPTAQSVREVRAAVGHETPIIATGGLRSGLDVAKAIALGADAGGMALPFFRAADQGEDEVLALGRRFVEELRIAMQCTGSPHLFALKRMPLQGAS